MWDVPGPGEEQEGPSSRICALRADLRNGVGWPAERKEAGPKAGIHSTLVPSALEKHRIRFKSLPIAVRATALPHQPAMLLPTTTDLGTLHTLNLIHCIPRVTPDPNTRQIMVWVTYHMATIELGSQKQDPATSLFDYFDRNATLHKTDPPSLSGN